MSYDYILADRVDGAAIFTLNRPEKLNALSFDLSAELDAELKKLEDDDDIKAVILTGAGDRAFSAGADIHEMADMSGEVLAARQERRNQTFWYVGNYPKPVIGAINGLAFGGGALLTSGLDIRIGCERSAFRFLAASYGRVNSSWSLPTLIGLPKAKELLYTGREVKAEEAERIGLLNQVVPAADLLDTAIEMAQLMAKNDARMVQGLKRLLTEQIGMGYTERYENEEQARETWLLAGHPRDGFKDFSQPQGTLRGEWTLSYPARGPRPSGRRVKCYGGIAAAHGGPGASDRTCHVHQWRVGGRQRSRLSPKSPGKSRR